MFITNALAKITDTLVVMQNKPYAVKLDDIFEGPMDLLVHLIKKNEVDIHDIPIALITDQYLEYINWMESMNIDFAGDFLFMAATLTQIKSKTLLPVHQGIGDDDDEDDPRHEITKPLIEYLHMKSAAEQLSDRNLLGKNIFIRMPGSRDEYPEKHENEFIRVGLFELIDAFQNVLEKLPGEHRIDLAADRISVKDKISEIVDILEKKNSVTFMELFPEKPEKSDVVVTFLAVLELVKLHLIKIAQHVQTGFIRLFYL